MVTGLVRSRKKDDYNLKIKTGKLEILVSSLKVLGKAKHILPFEVITSHEVSEDVRFKYRYLDLRNKKVHDLILFRSDVIKYLREYMKDILAYQYDFVCDGVEMASGAVRNHDIEIMKKTFSMVGIQKILLRKNFHLCTKHLNMVLHHMPEWQLELIE